MTPQPRKATEMLREAVESELVAIHQRAWNREMERQRQAAEPVNHIKATRAALAAVIPCITAHLGGENNG